MKNTTITRISKLAIKYSREKVNWHFHILLPGCAFNKNKKYALILENTDSGEQYIYLSLRRPSKTGQKLVVLLHGEGISKSKTVKASGKPLSARVKKMIDRAMELNNKGFSWHHHLLFPNCVFNKDSRYWTLVFEDPLNGEIIEDKSSKEPKEALAKIELLYYSNSAKKHI